MLRELIANRNTPQEMLKDIFSCWKQMITDGKLYYKESQRVQVNVKENVLLLSWPISFPKRPQAA